jgi:hypothetical protein
VHSVDLNPFTQGFGNAFKGRDLDVFGVVFDPRYGCLLRMDATGKLFLRQAGSLAGLAEDFSDSELLVALVEPFGECLISILPLLNVSIHVAHDLNLLPRR